MGAPTTRGAPPFLFPVGISRARIRPVRVRRQMLSLVLTFALLATSASLLRARADQLKATPTETPFDIPPFSAEVARPFSFGLRSLVADLTFLEAIQIHGGLRGVRTAADGASEDRALNRLLTYSTDLDPKFAGSYRFA